MPFKATKKDEDTSFKPSGHVSSTLKKKKRTRSQTEVNSIDAETPLPRRRTRQSISAPDSTEEPVAASSSHSLQPRKRRREAKSPDSDIEADSTLADHSSQELLPFRVNTPHTPNSHNQEVAQHDISADPQSPSFPPQSPPQSPSFPQSVTPPDLVQHQAPFLLPLSILDSSPFRPQGGRSRVMNPVRNPKGFKKSEEYKQLMELERTQREARQTEQRIAVEEERHRTKEAERLNKVDRAHDVIQLITQPESESGFGFESLKEFFDSMMDRGSDSQITANISRFCRDHGASLASAILDRSEGAYTEFLDGYMAERVQKEGAAIQRYLSRPSGTPMTDVVNQFSLEKFRSDLQELAPTIWKLLLSAAVPANAAQDGGVRRNKELVFVSICAMISMLRSQKANNFQVVIGFFLLGSGASKREIEVLHQAGLSISYTAVMEHIRLLG
ncbi:hypothetical protein K435DRAFT_875094 [Dendrothele bispora CBS 962.96]|uniref:Uncharacterized protein n=1 Tax=Dendrothele bispora (strain CBS 962.96) TaxID=1314807 RepID=A0A4V4HBK1_DENBC|nr:hypothetical protein K435DRAFT_875094 [Dendrothele bispora CBS 962.96]